MAEQTSVPATPANTESTLTASAGPLTIPWPFANLDDVYVTLTDSSGVVTPQVRGVDYNITATVNDDGLYPSGTLLFVAPVTGTVRRYRITAAERESQLPLTGFLSRPALNADLNRLMMAIGDLRSEVETDMRVGDLAGTWATAHSYLMRDIVIDGAAGASTKNYYIATEDHTSGVWATDLAAGKWQLLIDVGSLVASLGVVTLNGNNPFTGNNTHTGTESFSNTVTMTGGVVLSGASAVSVPTVPASDNDTSAASTAFVQGEFALRPGRNKLINGDFSIDQRNEGAAQTFTAAAAVAYTVDRWYASCTGANITGQRVAGTAPNQYAYKFTGAASNTGLLFGQRIESNNCYDWTNQTVFGSVSVASSSITTLTWKAYTADVTDTFAAKTQIATGTITINSTMTRYSFSFAAGANAGRGVAIEYSCGALLAAQTIQFETAQAEDTRLTAFERLHIGERRRQCRRYYLRRKATGAAQLNLPGYGQTTNVAQYWIDRFDVEMRAAPTGTISAAGDFQILAANATFAATGLSAVAASAEPWGVAWGTSHAAFSVNIPGILQSANANAWMALSAEL